MRHVRNLLLILISSLLAACAASYYVENPNELINASPQVEVLDNKQYDANTEPGNIELYYYKWPPLTEPNLIIGWKYHFVIGEPSTPLWPYTKLSEITISQAERDDKKAIKELRDIASAQGGNALVDLHREPMIDEPNLGSHIVGYRYYATVVRKK